MSKNFPGKQEMIDLLISRGIKDESLIDAMKLVKREDFISDPFKMRAYEDCALPIGYDQTISQPYTVAVMTEALEVKKRSKILEIGTGSGYQALILYQMGATVFTIERNLNLHAKAKEYFSKNNFSIITKFGDGSLGWEEFSPFDGIIVTAGAPVIPENLKKQLADGGKLVIPVGSEVEQNILVIKKQKENFTTKTISGFKFVPLIGRDGW